MVEQTKICPLCRRRARVLESHHLVPLCYGGKKEGRQKLICNTCHRDIHSFERNDDVPPAHLTLYVDVVRKARAAFTAGDTVALDSRKHVPVQLSEEQERIVDRMAVRFNTRGRAATILALIDRMGIEWRFMD